MTTITQADREILAGEYDTDPRYAGNAKVVRDGTHDDDTMYKHPLRAIAKVREERDAARALLAEAGDIHRRYEAKLAAREHGGLAAQAAVDELSALAARIREVGIATGGAG